MGSDDMTHTARHDMGRIELRAKIELFEAELKGLRRIDTGCGGCIHSEHRKDGTCTKWNQVVPQEHRAAGCDEWVYDEIPF